MSSTVAMSLLGGCEKGPTEAPAGKKLATFAGMSISSYMSILSLGWNTL